MDDRLRLPGFVKLARRSRRRFVRVSRELMDIRNAITRAPLGSRG